VTTRSDLQPWVDARSRAVAATLSTDPYVRSARLLGYSLRSQVRGFFHDPRHPAARKLLEHLFVIGIESRDATPDMIQRVERLWNEAGETALAGAWKALVREAADAIEAARGNEPTPLEEPLDDPEHESRRANAFAAWLATNRGA